MYRLPNAFFNAAKVGSPVQWPGATSLYLEHILQRRHSLRDRVIGRNNKVESASD